jgi:TonB family protein
MTNRRGNNRWYRIAPSVLISVAINAAIIIALSVVITSPNKKDMEYPVNYSPVKIDNKKIIKPQPIIKKRYPVIKNNKNKPVKVVKPQQKKTTKTIKQTKNIVPPKTKVVPVKTVTPNPMKSNPDNSSKPASAKTNPAAVAKNNTASGNNNPLPENNPGGGGGRNNNLANDTPDNKAGNINGAGRPGRIGPGNLPGRPGPGNGDDNPGNGEPTFGSPLTPNLGGPGDGDGGPDYGTGTGPGDGGGPGGTGRGVGPGAYRGGDGDGPGKGGWGGDGTGEPRNLAMAGTSEMPGDKSKTKNGGTPGAKLNPESGTPGYSRKARAIKLTAPEYPSVARRRGQEGDVYVRVDISEEGRPVGKPVIVISSGVYQLDQSAMEYVQNTDLIQYVPAMKGGKPARDSVVVQVTFKLNDDGKF